MDTFKLITGILGGLGLFIFGMGLMGEGLQRAAGDRLRKILETLTKLPVMGVLTGALVTSVIQSSSATTVMVVGFVNAGLMSLKQAIGIIMGANIGTTITAQLIAFKLSDYLFLIIALGFALYFFSKKRLWRYVGQVVLGFGILFLGLNVMQTAVAPLKESQAFASLITDFGRYPLLGVLAGMAMTVIIQSSSATIGMLIAMANQGLVPFDVAIPVLFGDNIGTCVTAVLASIGTNLNARRAALAHVLFNVIGAIIFLAFLPWFKAFVAFISPDAPARLIANAHTSFNTLNTMIMLPLINHFAHFIARLLPGEDRELRRGPIYLDERMLESPAVALSLATREIIRMAALAAETLENAMQGFFQKDPKRLETAFEQEEVVDQLEKAITIYLAKLSQQDLTPAQSEKHTGLLHAVNDIERVGDHAENVAELAQVRIEENLPFSDYAIAELEEMYNLVSTTFKRAIEALQHGDVAKARQVLDDEPLVDELEKELRKSHLIRLNRGICYPESGVVFLDIISNLERVGDHANNIAHVVLDDF
ncbi:MAG: Na/Pi cotransporter family protein [Bacillota bacterium]|nr:Na/Pi cotransporter family protein [Bacillota bacterium]